MNIDVSKCIGCRKGVSRFAMLNGKLGHIDLFTPTPAFIECANANAVRPHLRWNDHDGTLFPDTELQPFFFRQEQWWEAINDIAGMVFHEDYGRAMEWFRTEINGVPIGQLSSEDMERLLLLEAEEAGYAIDQEDYGALMKFQS